MSAALIGLTGYGASAVAFGGLGLLLALRHRGDAVGGLLLAAVLGQAVWSALLAAGLAGVPAMGLLAPIGEAVRNLLWLLFLIRLATASSTAQDPTDPEIERAANRALMIALVLATASAGAELIGSGPALLFASRTLVAIFGLVCIEQVYRNASETRRWAIKFLALALVALFGFDLILYSEAMLFGKANASWWVARGYASLLLVPLIAIAAARNPHWKLDIGVSRQAVFHSAALSIAGAYLILIAAGGYWLRWFGGEWGEIAQTLLVFAALLGLAVMLMSGQARARLRVFLAKHFFSYRFDYREQWMRLTDLLSREDRDDLALRTVTGLGQAVSSGAGALWLESEGSYRFEGGIGWHGDRTPISAAAPLVRLLRERNWIVDLDAVRNAARARTPEPGVAGFSPAGQARQADPATHNGNPEAGLELPAPIAAHEAGWLIVPLSLDGELLGFIVLDQPLAPQTFDWETRDLLHAAARQIASHLGLKRTLEQLIRAQQFESFNRMSAFVVHDLKNLVAQLGLMTKNAQKHHDNPEFQADMLATVENVMERMQGLLLQLRAGARPVEAPAPVALRSAVAAAIEARPTLRPAPTLQPAPALGEPDREGEAPVVMAHRERLERVIGHLIQNAAEACQPDEGRVDVTIGRDCAMAVIEVRDNGRGMSEAFIRDKLFQPFTSTKAHGMGIGAFESREYLKELGGSLDVESEEGVGTIFRVRLPMVGATRSQSE
jgi:signal transduction histidine kinase